MTFERKVAAVFSMGEEAWARHANPWSVWTRFTVLPLLILAVWSRAWIGRWALLPSTAAILWMWGNPRLFGRPRSTDNWASKAVLGERVWMDRDRIPVPRRHQVLPHAPNAVSAAGMVFVVWGLRARAVRLTLLGIALVCVGKLLFLDRMVRLYAEMKDADPRYRNWLY